MNRLAIVFWSGTGNTEQMADCIGQGARGACRNLGRSLASW